MHADTPLVITGASGFVGRRLLRQLADAGARNVTLLLNKSSIPDEVHAAWRVESANLTSGSLPTLPSGCVVLHMAAATGKASPEAMHAVNVTGTRRLLEAATAAQARHVVFVSSIAAGFSDRRWYHYAESKREAEALVRNSGIRSTIVRPTMIFGYGSAVQKGLRTLAVAPWPVIFGAGSVHVQPVSVDDVAALLHSLAMNVPAHSDTSLTVEIGGPERLSMADLIARLRRSAGAVPRGAIHLPAQLMRRALGAVEPVLRPLLPLTAGQLASFVNDSVAAPHPLIAERLLHLTSLEEMLGQR